MKDRKVKNKSPWHKFTPPEERKPPAWQEKDILPNFNYRPIRR